jgi:hypothetical protein
VTVHGAVQHGAREVRPAAAHPPALGADVAA